MPGAPNHNKAIAAAAKAALTPIGFKRRGQSRVWLADHGYWLLIVEFQPNSWEKGSFLNVAAHWLWHPAALDDPLYYLSYDFSRQGFSRVEGFVALDKASDYDAIIPLADKAVAEAGVLRALLPSLDAAEGQLLAIERARPADQSPHWSTYHAAVAAALTGQGPLAVEYCEAILATEASPHSALHPATAKLRDLARDTEAVRAHIEALIAARRAAFKLPPNETAFA